MKWNYLTEKEAQMDPGLVDLQIAIALQSCVTKKDVMELLQDVRQHERLLVADIIAKTAMEQMLKDEKEAFQK